MPPSLTVSMTLRATPSRSAGQPQLRPSRPCALTKSGFTYGAPCITMARSRARSLKPVVEPVQAQRIAVLADIRVVGDEQPDAGGMGVGLV